MKLESQVTSLEISKRLKELGVKQESLFWWDSSNSICCAGPKRMGNTFYPENLDSYYTKNTISAFTVAELGEMLPEDITVEGINYQIQFTNGIHSIGYQGEIDVSVFKVIHETIGLTEVDARGKMLIYLLENGLIEK